MSLDKELEVAFVAAKSDCGNGLHFEKPKLLTFDMQKMLSKRNGSEVYVKKRKLSSNDEDNGPDEESQYKLTCPVCTESYSVNHPFKKPVFLRCIHSLCYSCALIIKKNPRPKCPMCKASIGSLAKFPTNFYLINFMKKRKRVAKQRVLSSWCNDCKGIAKEQCSTHALQHMPESICRLAGIQNQMQTSLSGILTDMTEASSCSFDVINKADSLLSKAFLELSTLITGVASMSSSIAEQECIIKRQFEEIQNKMKTIEPFKGFEADIAGTPGSNLKLTSALPEDLSTGIRCYTHQNQIKIANSLQDAINVLTIIEKCMNCAIKNKELINSKVALIDADGLRLSVHEKIQTFLDVFERSLARIRDIKVILYGEDKLQTPPIKPPIFI